MKAVLVDGELFHAAGWAKDAGADCVVLAADSAVAGGMESMVDELRVSFGMNCRTGGLEDMVARAMDGEFDHYRFVLVFSSLTDAMRAAVMGLKFDAVELSGGAGRGALDPKERYAVERLKERGVTIRPAAEE